MLDSDSRTYKVLEQIGVDYVRFAKININDRNWKRRSKLTGKIRKGKIDSSGALRKSIKYDIDESSGEMVLFIEGNEYAQDVNDGKKRNTSPASVKQWMKDKRLRLTDEKGFIKMTPALVDSFANFVAWKVSKIGSDYTGFLDVAQKQSFDKHESALTEAIAGDSVEAIIDTFEGLEGLEIDMKF